MINKNVLFFSPNKVPLTFKGQWSPISGQLPSTETYDNGTLLRVSVDGTISSVFYKAGSFIFNNSGTWQRFTSYDYADLNNKPSLGNLSGINATTEGLAFANYVSSNLTQQNTLLSYLGGTSIGVNLFRAPNEAAALNVLNLPSNLVDQVNSKQPLNQRLTEISEINGTGLLRQTAGVWSLDTTAFLISNQNITISGDGSGSGSTSINFTLSNTGVAPGTYAGITVNSKGRITQAVQLNTLIGYGIIDAAPLSHVGSGGGAAHPIATGSTSGFMSSASYTKLENIAENATANESDSFLLDRVNHTGEQPQSSITGLAASLAAKVNTTSIVQNLDTPSTSTVLSSQALVAELADLVAGQQYLGQWDSELNNPTIVSSVGNEGDYYVVSVGSEGITTIDGNDDWPLGAEIIYSGGVWLLKPIFNLVTSVQGLTGDIELDKDDIGLDQVDNTSDANKIVSGPQQSALNLKENLSNKVQDLSGSSTTSFPSIKAVKDYLQNNFKINSGPTTLNGALIYAGTTPNGEPIAAVQQPLFDAAYKSTNSSQTDTSTNIVMMREYLGIGSLTVINLPNFSTFNDVPRINCLTASVNLSASDRPYVSPSNFVVNVKLSTAGTWLQEVCSPSTKYYRIEVSGSWTSWKIIFDSNNTLNIGATDLTARAALNLGTAAVYNVSSSLSASTPNTVLLTGSGGVNSTALPNDNAGTLNTNFNSAFISINNHGIAGIGTLAGISSRITTAITTSFLGRNDRYFGISYENGVQLSAAEFWHSKNLVKSTSPIDTTANRFIETGYAGLGRGAIGIEDFNSIPIHNGFIAGINSSPANRPTGTNWTVGLHLARTTSNSESAEIVIGTNGNTGLHYRARYNVGEVYYDWRTVYDTGNVQTPAKNLFNATTPAEAQTALGFGSGALVNYSNSNIGNTLVYRDLSGNISAGPVYTNISQSTSANVTDFYVGKFNDNGIYKVSPASARTGLGLGNAATATLPSIAVGANDFEVSKYLRWRNHVNSHVIFDASSSLSPTGTAINNSNPVVAWSAAYPTLMGWNGTQSYGVKVDRSRTAENALALDNFTLAVNSTADTVVRRDSLARINVATLNASISPTTATITNFFIETGSDGWLRKVAPATVISQLNLASNTGDTFTGKIVVQLNTSATPNYSGGQLELRTTNDSPVVLGFHRAGTSACSLVHNANGLILTGTTYASRAAFEAAGITGTTGTFTGSVTAANFYGNGQNLTNLNASSLSTGTVAVARLPNASTSSSGIVQLSNLINSTSQTIAASSLAVKSAYDQAVSAATTAGTALSTANSANGLAQTAQDLAILADNTASSAVDRLDILETRPFQKFTNVGNISGTWNINAATQGTHYIGTVTGNLTIAFSNDAITSGNVCAFSFELTNVGNFSLTLPSGTRKNAGVAPPFQPNSTGCFVLTKCFGQNWRFFLSDGDNR